MRNQQKHSSRSRRRRHHHGKWYRLKRWFRYNKKFAVFLAFLCFSVIFGAGFFVYRSQQRQSSRHVTAENSVDLQGGYRNITWNGQEYQYNNLITTVLFIGIDSEGAIEEGAYTMAPRADSINLVILDKQNKKMTIMAFSRDTMTEIHRFALSGRDRGTYTSHLGLAYTYGNGAEVSCENVVQAVSDLLGGIPIQEYVTANVSSLAGISSLVGGVTVTVPNNDLAEEYPEFRQGAQVVLDETNTELFLRSRDIAEDFSNDGRLERQRAYMTAYVEQFKALIQEDLEGSWDKMQQMEEYVLTSITRNQYLTLANLLNEIDFTDGDYYTPEGEDRLGELHDEFYVDEEALQEKVIELFYLPV